MASFIYIVLDWFLVFYSKMYVFFFSSLFWTVSQALSAGGEGGGGVQCS